MSESPPSSFTCPICGRTSYHVQHVEEGWCKRCHGRTGQPAPDGWTWALFTGGGPLDGRGRMVERELLVPGYRYASVWDEATYVYDAGVFRLDN